MSTTTTTPSTEGGTAVLTRSRPQPPKPLPPWKVLLHNDDHNSFEHVIKCLIQLCALSKEDAVQRTLEAHKTGLALVMTTHKERAEFHQEQLASVGLTATIEPDE